ncbi:MAG: neutral/alkaline non-lysosomal ceramidase N-terminal domain-containing protein [Phycisphaeraceae bacterium]
MNISGSQSRQPSSAAQPATWRIGAAETDITPAHSQYLFGYPHVARYSTGVHDPLLASAMYIGDGELHGALFVACDIIWVPQEVAQRARQRIAQATQVPVESIMVSATHTHSGPITASMISNADDPHVPPPDPAVLTQLEEGIVSAAAKAWRTAAPATLAYACVDGSALGTNRRDPAGASIPAVPMLVARDAHSHAPLAVMVVVSMHPTVLHEDWTHVSGDFPGLARRWLQANVVGQRCPLVYHMGAAGNQSPRHVVKANTIAEAERLGQILGRAIAAGIQQAQPVTPVSIEAATVQVDLPVRQFPSVQEASARLDQVKAHLKHLQETSSDRAHIRTAECDWFGAQETLTLARASANGMVDQAARSCMPALVQVIRIGEHLFVGWPGEIFVEFAQAVMQRHPTVHIITLANGRLEGYLVTAEAVAEGGYEASNAIFASPQSGQRLVDATLHLIDRLAPSEERR